MKRRPNGTGSVIKLSGSRRKPYEVRGPVKGYTDKGYPIFDRIGYAETYDQGLEMLIEYNKSPYDPLERRITLEELFNRWKADAAPKLGKKNQRALSSAYKHIQSLNQKQYIEITSNQMQLTIDRCGKGYSTQGIIKALWGHLDKYAYSLDVIVKKRSEELTSAPIAPQEKTPYTDQEIEWLWNHINDMTVITDVLILLYTGFRIREYLSIDSSAVDLEEMIITGGIKTAAGKNRIVPIHPKIQPLVKARLETNKQYISVNQLGLQMSYLTFNKRFKELCVLTGIHHTIHETRHTFRTRLDNAGANEKCMDLLMGHTSNSTGKRVYTHKTITELRDTILLLK